MKKEMDKLRSKIRTNKKFTIFLFILFLIGIIFGSLFITILSANDKILINEYLKEYIGVLQGEKIEYGKTLLNILLNSGLMIIAIWLLGLSVIGIPIILFLFFSKAFTLGFSIVSIFYVYKLKGIIFAIIYIFPHQIINLLMYAILLTYALSVSLKLIEAIFRKKNIDFKIIMGKYSIILGITLGVFALSSLYETFVMPSLVKQIIPFLT